MLSRKLSYKFIDLKFHQDSREALFSGIQKVSQVVSQTLGPKGKNIALEYEIGPPKITKDGVTVAKHLEFFDKWTDLGSKIIKFSANESNLHAGDGTTTSTILAHSILKQGLSYLNKGHHPILVKEGLIKAGTIVDTYLASKSNPVSCEEDLLSICKIACNSDKDLAKMLMEGVMNSGRDGAFLIEEGNSLEDRLTVSNGLVVPRGYASELFGISEFELKFENPLILVANMKLHETKPILHILEYAKKNGRSLVVAAEDVDKEAIQTLLYNKEKAELSCVAINFPAESSFEFLEDLAWFTGAQVINDMNLSELKPESLGSCARMNIDSMRSTFFRGKGDTKLRQDQILASLVNESDSWTQSVKRERLQRLSGKMAIFEIGLKGGKVSMGERRDRIVDSLNSIRSSCREGFLPGGGSSLLFAARHLKTCRTNTEQDVGFRILQEALIEPARIISANSGVGLAAVEQIWLSEDEEIGIDAEKGEICNMVERGIIDSTGVVRQAVRAAVSVSQMLIGTSAALARAKRYEPMKLEKYKKDIF